MMSTAAPDNPFEADDQARELHRPANAMIAAAHRGTRGQSVPTAAQPTPLGERLTSALNALEQARRHESPDETEVAILEHQLAKLVDESRNGRRDEAGRYAA